MIQANISTAKNKFSSYLEYIKRGETVIILDRQEPIAALMPYSVAKVAARWSNRVALLNKRGCITLPKNSKKRILKSPLITARPTRLIEALIEERSTGR